MVVLTCSLLQDSSVLNWRIACAMDRVHPESSHLVRHYATKVFGSSQPFVGKNEKEATKQLCDVVDGRQIAVAPHSETPAEK